MKNITFIFTLVLSVFIGSSVSAQETVPKEVLLTTLNGVNSLKLSNLKTTALMDYNKGYVDKVYDITESDKTEKDKKAALEVLSNDTEKDLVDLIGKKEYKQYAKLMEEELKPLAKKSKLFKYLY